MVFIVELVCKTRSGCKKACSTIENTSVISTSLYHVCHCHIFVLPRTAIAKGSYATGVHQHVFDMSGLQFSCF